MMRCPGKRTATVLSAAVMLALIAGCGSTSTTSPTATPPTAPPRSAGLAQILQRGTVRVCSTGDYRPFTFRDPQGNWSGLDIEMAHDMAARLGGQLDVVPTTWAHLVDDLDNKCDVAMGGISITLDRAKYARLFTTLGAAMGTAAANPILSQGHHGKPWQEKVAGTGFRSIAYSILIAVVLILWGPFPSPTIVGRVCPYNGRKTQPWLVRNSRKEGDDAVGGR